MKQVANKKKSSHRSRLVNIRFITRFIFMMLCSFSANATLISSGDLSSNSDGSTNYITDTKNNRIWLRWDLLAHLTYAETLDSIASDSSFYGWRIARQSDANLFYKAFMSNSNFTCGSTTSRTLCTPLEGETNTSNDVTLLLGDNDGTLGNDWAWFLSDQSNAGLIGKRQSGVKYAWEFWSDYVTISQSDRWSGNSSGVSWLLYKEASTVPIPSSLNLFAIGLLGLGLQCLRQRVIPKLMTIRE